MPEVPANVSSGMGMTNLLALGNAERLRSGPGAEQLCSYSLEYLDAELPIGSRPPIVK